MCVQSQIFEEKPNCSRWIHSLKIHQVHLEVVKNLKINAEAKLSMKIDKKN